MGQYRLHEGRGQTAASTLISRIHYLSWSYSRVKLSMAFGANPSLYWKQTKTSMYTIPTTSVMACVCVCVCVCACVRACVRACCCRYGILWTFNEHYISHFTQSELATFRTQGFVDNLVSSQRPVNCDNYEGEKQKYQITGASLIHWNIVQTLR